MASLRISPEAVRDIESIRDYIEADNPEAADRVGQELIDAIQQLAEWPGKGHIRLELASSDVRFWPVRSYLIIYTSPAHRSWNHSRITWSARHSLNSEIHLINQCNHFFLLE